MRRAGRVLKRPAAMLVVTCAALVVVGLAYAAAEGAGVRHSVTYALFIGGAAIVVFAGLSGGGGFGSRSTTLSTGRYQPADMPFGAVVIGVLVILVGVGLLEA